MWLTAIGTVTDDKGRTYSKESGEVIVYMTEKMKLNDAAVKTADTSSIKMEIENIDSSSMKGVIDNGSANNDHMNVVNDHIDNGNGFIDTSRVNNNVSNDNNSNNERNNNNNNNNNSNNNNHINNNNNSNNNNNDNNNNNHNNNNNSSSSSNQNNNQINNSVKLSVPPAVSRLGKRKYKDSISSGMLGTTTIAGRYKKMGAIPGSTNMNTTRTNTENNLKINNIEESNNNNNIRIKDVNNDENNNKNKNENNDLVSTVMTAGQFLIRLNFFLIFQDKTTVQYFTDSIKRRLSFETKKKLTLAEYEIEVRRRKLEEMNNLPMLRTVKESKYDLKPLSNEAKVLVKKEKESGIESDVRMNDVSIKKEVGKDVGKEVVKEVVKEEVEDSFEAMLGSPQDLAVYNMQANHNNNNNNNKSSTNNDNKNNNTNNNNNNNNKDIKLEPHGSMSNSREKQSDTNMNIKQETKSSGSVTIPTPAKKVKKTKTKIVVQMMEEE